MSPPDFFLNEWQRTLNVCSRIRTGLYFIQKIIFCSTLAPILGYAEQVDIRQVLMAACQTRRIFPPGNQPRDCATVDVPI